MKKILLFSRDPGGANAILPLVSPLKESGCEVLLFGKDSSLQKYVEYGIPGENIEEVIPEITQNSLEGFLKKLRLDFLLTGTSADDATEKYLWKAASSEKIPSAAMLDYWSNYGVRFSHYGVSSLEKFREKHFCDVLPDKIFVMDEFALREAMEDGVPRSRMVITGQPYFETVRRYSEQLDPELILKIRRKIRRPGELVIFFIGEPISETYGENTPGYTELAVLENILTAMLGVKQKYHLLIKPHPKEDARKYSAVKTPENVRVTVLSQNTDKYYYLKNSDCVLGMSSMLLLEAHLLNLPFASIQIGRKPGFPDSFVLSKFKQVVPIMSQSALDSFFKKPFSTIGKSIVFPADPIARSVQQIKELLK